MSFISQLSQAEAMPLMMAMPGRLEQLKRAYTTFCKLSARGNHDTAATYKQPIYQEFCDDAMAHQDLWFDVILDPGMGDMEVTYTHAEAASGILYCLAFMQRMNGPMYKFVPTMALADKFLQRLQLITEKHGGRQRKEKTEEHVYRCAEQTLMSYLHRRERDKAVPLFRISVYYEAANPGTEFLGDKVDNRAKLTPDFSVEDIRAMSDEDLWIEMNKGLKKLMGTKRMCCNYCDAVEEEFGDHSLCTRCRSAVYCSRNCQKLHWKSNQRC